MCQLASFFINRETLEIAAAGLVHHEQDAPLCGIRREDADCPWSECEWTGDDSGSSLVVRTVDASGESLKRHILSMYPTRQAFLRAAVVIAAKRGLHHVYNQSDADALALPAGSRDAIIVWADGAIVFWQVCSAGSIAARAATSLSLPALTTCAGYIDARAATSLSLPALQTCGDIDARAATSLSLSALTTCAGSICAGSATSLSLPALTTCAAKKII